MNFRLGMLHARRLSSCGAAAGGSRVKAKRNILDLSFEEMAGEMVKLSQPSYRARQLWTFIYSKLGTSFDHVPSFPSSLKQQLHDEFVVGTGAKGDSEAVASTSSDGTRKWAMPTVKAIRIIYFKKSGVDRKSLPGGVVEAVYIPENKRGTLCVSSQVGCSMKCSFCATGAMSKANLRNLTSGEIVEQVLQARRLLAATPMVPSATLAHNADVDDDDYDKDYTPSQSRISHIVMMGMGEPLYNWKNVRTAVKTMLSGDGISIGHRRITLSTCGVVPLIPSVGSELGVLLAVSLHAANDDLRNELVPINKQYPLSALMEACRLYPSIKHNRTLTFEYVMLANVNDSLTDAKQLGQLLSGIVCLVNLIPFNPWPGSAYAASPAQSIMRFANALQHHDNIKVTVRWPRGRDIQVIDASVFFKRFLVS